MPYFYLFWESIPNNAQGSLLTLHSRILRGTYGKQGIGTWVSHLYPLHYHSGSPSFYLLKYNLFLKLKNKSDK